MWPPIFDYWLIEKRVRIAWSVDSLPRDIFIGPVAFSDASYRVASHRVASRRWTTMKCMTRMFENREAPLTRTELLHAPR